MDGISVYETLDLRVAQHPSETMAAPARPDAAFALAYEEGLRSAVAVSARSRTSLIGARSHGSAPSLIEIERRPRKAIAQGPEEGRLDSRTSSRSSDARGRRKRRFIKADAIRRGPLTSFIDARRPSRARRSKLEIARTTASPYVTLGGQMTETPAGYDLT